MVIDAHPMEIPKEQKNLIVGGQFPPHHILLRLHGFQIITKSSDGSHELSQFTQQLSQYFYLVFSVIEVE